MAYHRGGSAFGILAICGLFLIASYGTDIFWPLLGGMVAVLSLALLLTKLFDRAAKRVLARMTEDQQRIAFYASLIGIAAFVGYQVI